MDVQAAINRYHELLTPELAEEADAILRERQKNENLYFGERPLCTVIRPHFYFESDWQFLKGGLERLLTAFRRVHDACVENDDYRAQLRLEPYEEELCCYDYGIPWTSSRLDTFFVVGERTLKCVEYNAETPAGTGYNEVLVDVFDNLELMRRFQEHYHVHSMPIMSDLLESILTAYRQWGGREHPQIGIVDWRTVPTLNEHIICKEYFERHGYTTRLADPHDLEYRDGQLWAGDFRIDVVYKRVLYSELLQEMGVDNPLLRAVRERAVYITNAPNCKLLAKKASLAILSDERNRDLFTAEQVASIDAHIPWTRLVEQRKTLYNGQPVDLLEFIVEHQQRLVLKPNDEYGGRGVVIGWESTPEEWQATLKLAAELPYVVQEGVQIVEREFPAVIDGQLDISRRFVDAAPYIFGGTTIKGCLTRLSPVTVLNVTAGKGSVVPSYIIASKNGA